METKHKFICSNCIHGLHMECGIRCYICNSLCLCDDCSSNPDKEIKDNLEEKIKSGIVNFLDGLKGAIQDPINKEDLP